MIPTNWSQVTLENFYPFARTLSEEPKTELQMLELMIKRACFLSNEEVEVIEDLPAEELNKVNELIATPYPTKINKFIRFKGQLYKVILDPRKEKSWRYKAIMNECRKEGDNLHRLMYLCCVPIKSILNQKEIEVPAHEVAERMESFKQLPISIVNPIVVFFCSHSKTLTENILSFSDQELRKMNKTIQEEIEYFKNMDG